MSLPQPLPQPLPHTDARLPVHVPSPQNRAMLARRRSQNRTKASKNMAIEVGAMMVVNGFVAAIALVTIIKLIPHNATQQEQLQSLEAEVTALDRRVEDLRKEFVQYFDPQQAQVNKRKLSDRLNAGQRKIILIPPSTNDNILSDSEADSEVEGP